MNISIIVPVYNVEKYVRRCLQSIMDQTFTDGVECIIVNDCTPDNSMSIVREMIEGYKGNIIFRIIENETNLGSAGSRNVGIDNSKGIYIIQFDSDDYIDPDMLECLYKEAEKNNSDVVVSDFIHEFQDRSETVLLSFEGDKIQKIRNALIGTLNTAVWTKLIRKEVLDENQIRYINNANQIEDYRFSVMLLYYSNIISYFPRAFYHYDLTNVSSLCHHMSVKRLEEVIINLNSLKAFLVEKDIYREVKDAFNKYLVEIKFELLFYTKSNKQKKYNILFPESVEQLPNSNINFYWKIALYCAYHNNLWVFNLLRSFRDLIKRELPQRFS